MRIIRDESFQTRSVIYKKKHKAQREIEEEIINRGVNARCLFRRNLSVRKMVYGGEDLQNCRQYRDLSISIFTDASVLARRWPSFFMREQYTRGYIIHRMIVHLERRPIVKHLPTIYRRTLP